MAKDNDERVGITARSTYRLMYEYVHFFSFSVSVSTHYQREEGEENKKKVRISAPVFTGK